MPGVFVVSSVARNDDSTLLIALHSAFFLSNDEDDAAKPEALDQAPTTIYMFGRDESGSYVFIKQCPPVQFPELVDGRPLKEAVSPILREFIARIENSQVTEFFIPNSASGIETEIDLDAQEGQNTNGKQIARQLAFARQGYPVPHISGYVSLVQVNRTDVPSGIAELVFVPAWGEPDRDKPPEIENAVWRTTGRFASVIAEPCSIDGSSGARWLEKKEFKAALVPASDADHPGPAALSLSLTFKDPDDKPKSFDDYQTMYAGWGIVARLENQAWGSLNAATPVFQEIEHHREIDFLRAPPGYWCHVALGFESGDEKKRAPVIQYANRPLVSEDPRAVDDEETRRSAAKPAGPAIRYLPPNVPINGTDDAPLIRLPFLKYGQTLEVLPYFIGHGGVLPAALTDNGNPCNLHRTAGNVGTEGAKVAVVRTLAIGAVRTPALMDFRPRPGVSPLADELSSRSAQCWLYEGSPLRLRTTEKEPTALLRGISLHDLTGASLTIENRGRSIKITSKSEQIWMVNGKEVRGKISLAMTDDIDKFTVVVRGPAESETVVVERPADGTKERDFVLKLGDVGIKQGGGSPEVASVPGIAFEHTSAVRSARALEGVSPLNSQREAPKDAQLLLLRDKEAQIKLELPQTTADEVDAWFASVKPDDVAGRREALVRALEGHLSGGDDPSVWGTLVETYTIDWGTRSVRSHVASHFARTTAALNLALKFVPNGKTDAVKQALESDRVCVSGTTGDVVHFHVSPAVKLSDAEQYFHPDLFAGNQRFRVGGEVVVIANTSVLRAEWAGQPANIETGELTAEKRELPAGRALVWSLAPPGQGQRPKTWRTGSVELVCQKWFWDGKPLSPIPLDDAGWVEWDKVHFDDKREYGRRQKVRPELSNADLISIPLSDAHGYYRAKFRCRDRYEANPPDGWTPFSDWKRQRVEAATSYVPAPPLATLLVPMTHPLSSEGAGSRDKNILMQIDQCMYEDGPGDFLLAESVRTRAHKAVYSEQGPDPLYVAPATAVTATPAYYAVEGVIGRTHDVDAFRPWISSSLAVLRVEGGYDAHFAPRMHRLRVRRGLDPSFVASENASEPLLSAGGNRLFCVESDRFLDVGTHVFDFKIGDAEPVKVTVELARHAGQLCATAVSGNWKASIELPGQEARLRMLLERSDFPPRDGTKEERIVLDELRFFTQLPQQQWKEFASFRLAPPPRATGAVASGDLLTSQTVKDPNSREGVSVECKPPTLWRAFWLYLSDAVVCDWVTELVSFDLIQVKQGSDDKSVSADELRGTKVEGTANQFQLLLGDTAVELKTIDKDLGIRIRQVPLMVRRVYDVSGAVSEKIVGLGMELTKKPDDRFESSTGIGFRILRLLETPNEDKAINSLESLTAMILPKGKTQATAMIIGISSPIWVK